MRLLQLHKSSHNGANDPWTCLTYDARGRVTQQTIPAYEGSAGADTGSCVAFFFSDIAPFADPLLGTPVYQMLISTLGKIWGNVGIAFRSAGNAMDGPDTFTMIQTGETSMPIIIIPKS